MSESGMVMIHNPSTIAMGSAVDMRKTADLLDSVRDAIVASYRRHSDKSDDELVEMMAATTWMTAAQAIENGFATEIAKGAPVTACFNPDAIAALGDIPETF